MKAPTPSSLLLTLSTHYYLTSALPVGLRARNPRPATPDYPVVNIVDPEADVVGFSGDDDDGSGITVTRTITQKLAPSITVTRTQFLSEPTSETEEPLDTAVPVVDVKETKDHSQATVTVYHNNPAPSPFGPASSRSSWSSISTTVASSSTVTPSSSTTFILETSITAGGTFLTVLPWTPPESDPEWSWPLSSFTSEVLSSISTVAWDGVSSVTPSTELPTTIPGFGSQPETSVPFDEAPTPSIPLSYWKPAPEQEATPTTTLEVAIPLSTGTVATSVSEEFMSRVIQTSSPYWNATAAYKPRKAE